MIWHTDDITRGGLRKKSNTILTNKFQSFFQSLYVGSRQNTRKNLKEVLRSRMLTS